VTGHHRCEECGNLKSSKSSLALKRLRILLQRPDRIVLVDRDDLDLLVAALEAKVNDAAVLGQG